MTLALATAVATIAGLVSACVVAGIKVWTTYVSGPAG